MMRSVSTRSTPPFFKSLQSFLPLVHAITGSRGFEHHFSDGKRLFVIVHTRIVRFGFIPASEVLPGKWRQQIQNLLTNVWENSERDKILKAGEPDVKFADANVNSPH